MGAVKIDTGASLNELPEVLFNHSYLSDGFIKIQHVNRVSYFMKYD